MRRTEWWCGILLGLTGLAQADDRLYLDPKAPLEVRVSDLMKRLTLEDKIALMAGGSSFATTPIIRLGVPALRVSDGPNGVRSNDGRATTVFPTGSALAATWNPAVVREVGEAIGREARALRIHVMLGPDVNLQRVPLAGRNFEDFSEDPELTAEMGIAMVEGIQSQGVGTSVKHFVGNEQELARLDGDSKIDERTLRELYLRPFERIVTQAHPWTVMISYNRLNGTFMSENRPLITQVLQGEWRFDGLVMSDWGAVHNTVPAANSGLTLEMPGPAKVFGRDLTAAVRAGQVQTRAVEEAAKRMVRLILRCGVLDGRIPPPGELLSAGHHKIALDAARESIVLLKNDHILPLDRSHLSTLAVIGPNADVPLYEGGGSSHAIPEEGDGPTQSQTPLKQLKQLAGSGTRIVYARGVDNDEIPPPMDARLLSPATPRRGEPDRGLSFSFYGTERPQGTPLASGVESDFDKVMFTGIPGVRSASWEGTLAAPQTGPYEFSIGSRGDVSLEIDGKQIIGPEKGTSLPPQIDFGPPSKLATVNLEAGHRYSIKVDYSSAAVGFPSMRLGMRLPPPSLEEAVAAASHADAAIVFVGSSRSTETEGRDRSTLALGGRQNELVQAVLAANPHTVVVLQSGSPYELPWADKAPAIVEGWLDGEQGPLALAQVLYGEVSPSGKLPFTFPRQLADNPTQPYYPAGKEAVYGEGVLMGYRWYDTRKIEPLFPFGHGLSYTTFAYSDLHAPAKVAAGQSLQVSLQVRNEGTQAAKETVQLYVGAAQNEKPVRPVKELKGFEKISLAPGEAKTVRFKVSPRDLAYYDATAHRWVTAPGIYHLSVGSSSRDIRLSQDFQWGSVK